MKIKFENDFGVYCLSFHPVNPTSQENKKNKEHEENVL